MPSEKRARQRRLRDEKVAVEQQRVKRRRGVRRGIGAVVVAGVVVGLVALLSNHPAAKKNASKKTTSTTTTIAGATTTTKPGASTTTTAAATTTTKPAATSTTKPGASTTTTKPKASTTTASTTTTAPTTTTAATTTTTLATETANGSPICPPAAGSAKRVITFKKPPPICVGRTGVYDATFTTDAGTFVMRMNAAKNLVAVNNFVFLARYHFFDGILFHRVIPGFVVQGGDPTGTGNGGPGYSWDGPVPLKTCEATMNCYPTWTVAMANSTGPSSNGSQFFIVLPGGGNAGLSALYTTIGTVVSGTNVVAKIGADGSQSGTPTHEHKMTKVTISQVSP